MSPRPTLREILFVLAVAAWILAVLSIERAPPPTPPVVPYGESVSRRSEFHGHKAPRKRLEFRVVRG